MQKAKWYLDRIRLMTPSEVAYRFATALRSSIEGLMPVQVPRPIAHQTYVSVARVLADSAPVGNLQAYTSAADRILRGEYDVFNLIDVQLGTPPRWNRDPKSGKLAPYTHSYKIDYRDECIVGDIKYLWEPNRHLHLVVLAQAYAITRNQKYSEELVAHLQSWFLECPYLTGPNWTSALEAGIRLINWSLCWQLLGGYESDVFQSKDGRKFRDQWLTSVYQHTKFVARRYSRFSSANNHLIGEAAGVYVACATWPYWTKSKAWGDRSKKILLDEARGQIAGDGGTREQAIAYQQFVFDFLLIAGLTARSINDDFPSEYWKILERMVDFLNSLMSVSGDVPMIGDADDGYVVRLSPDSDTCCYRSIIATGAILFSRSDLAVRAGRLDDKSRWLLCGASADLRFKSLLTTRVRNRKDSPTAFRDSGYYILGSKLGEQDEIKMVVDVGPLGFLSIAAHGHADALSVWLSVSGQEILIDPGTYCYHTSTKWRSYFRSTKAHNTVVIDGQDQSIQRGNFMWSDHATSTCLQFVEEDGRQVLTAEHDGYARLRDPVVHRRQVSFSALDSTFEIVDTFHCKAEHSVIRNWQLHEELIPSVDRTGFSVVKNSSVVRFRFVEEVDEQRTLRGSKDPIGGWVSRAFGRKQPASMIQWANKISGNTSLRTIIKVL